MENIINSINSIIWSPLLIYLCLGAGLFFSIITRFVQVRHFGEMCRLLFRGNTSKEGISSFQAFTVALSGRVGMGNIAGVAAAIGFGGPGAVFWMWAMAFLGASTAYVESTLAQIYKENTHGQYRGGPAYYIEKFFGKALGILMAVAFVASCGLFLPGAQANGVVSAVVGVTGEGTIIHTAFGELGMNKLIALVLILIVLALIIFGGIRRIAKFTEIVVPFMALGYIVLALTICFLHINQIPDMIALIISDAFSAQAGLGAAIGWGVKRGVYSNEAGQGTGAHHAAAAEVEHPVQQGLVQAFSVYIDTLFVCSATAFMILITQQYNITLNETFAGADTQYIVANIVDASGAIIHADPSSPAFTQLALYSIFGNWGNIFVAIAVFFFAFTTILAYYYIAETNIAYLCRNSDYYDFALFFIKIVLMTAVAYGAVNSSGYIWAIGDIGVGMTAWLNVLSIIAIFFMAKPTITCLKDYEIQQKQKVKNYQFDPIKLGIKNATFWEKKL